ncbi:chitinase-like protein 3 [Bacillus rossius redtenbacheri]|uniref:chitinase-like protein 3 n=1 Tax=Bacillus rossius redtenbacheri TaxID=93214 RepID=UPI002FDDBEDB
MAAGPWLLVMAACCARSAAAFHVIDGASPLNLEEAEGVSHNNVMMCYVFASQLDATLTKNPFPEFLCLCSTLVILKAELLPNGFVVVEDPIFWKGLMQKLLMVRMRVPHLKVVVSVHGSASYSAVTSSPLTMLQCARNIAMWLREYRFHGFEIDWQYPCVGPGSSPLDRVNLPVFLRALERELDKVDGDACIILRVGYQPSLLTTSYIPKELGGFVEKIVLDVLDMHDSAAGTAGFDAPLYYRPGDRDRFNNVDAVVRLWRKAGVSADKLVLNVPVFGTSYQLAEGARVDPGAATVGPGPPAWITREPGIMSYKEVCELVSDKSSAWKTIYDQFAMIPYSTDGKAWVSHENIKSVTSKALYAIANDLGGVAAYTVDNDDAEGTCHQERYPLLSALLEVTEPKRFLACRNMNLYVNVSALGQQMMGRQMMGQQMMGQQMMGQQMMGQQMMGQQMMGEQMPAPGMGDPGTQVGPNPPRV